MTTIKINGLTAVMKAGSEFEYNAENPSFSDSEGFTLSIEFPLKGCPENQKIFGYAHLEEVVKDTTLFKCTIECGAFSKSGALAIIEVSEVSLKGQFLEGVNPEHEEKDSENLYINELNLGQYPYTKAEEISPREARLGTSCEVCLPWVPEGYDVVNCLAEGDKWHEESKHLAWQPYLLEIMQRICMMSGYTHNFAKLNESHWGRAIICNTLPPTWNMHSYADAMPHWTVKEFFTQLGILMNGVFTFDESAKRITFNFYTEIVNKIVTVENILDEYSSIVTRDEEDADYLPIKFYKYRDSSAIVWKYLSAPWLKFSERNCKYYDTWEDFQSKHNVSSPAYVAEADTYVVGRTVTIYSKNHVADNLSAQYPYAFWKEWMPVNVFGPPDYDEDRSYEDMGFNPVIVDYALEGKMMFLPVSYSGTGNSGISPIGGSGEGGFVDHNFSGGQSMNLNNLIRLSTTIPRDGSRWKHQIESHEDDDEGVFFSDIYIGFMHDDIIRRPYPLTDVDFYYTKLMSEEAPLRLRKGGAGGMDIDPAVKYTFKFLAESLPDVNSRFVIHGQLYIAQRLTATFNEKGMNPIVKGEFFRIRQDSL